MGDIIQHIIVDNPTKLPLARLDDFHTFQGDFKMPMSAERLQALKQAILDHRIFIGKAAALLNGILYTEDGHQTFTALKSLRSEGYTSCIVIQYAEQDGNMVQIGEESYDNIMIPYQLIVPQGDTEEAVRKDAAAKIAIINSQYAMINPNTTLFTSLGFDTSDLHRLQSQIVIPELSFTDFAAFSNVVPPSHSGGTVGTDVEDHTVTEEFMPDDYEDDLDDIYDRREDMSTYPNRAIFVYQNEEQKQWLEMILKQSLTSIITPVETLMKNYGQDTTA